MKTKRSVRLLQRAFLTLILCGFLTSGGWSLLAKPQQDPLPPTVAEKITQLIQKSGVKEDVLGISIYSTRAKAVLFNLNAERPAVLASNTKLFTSTAALSRLGPNFQFNTLVTTRGQTDPNGTLSGDLIVIGDGDPNISGRFFGGDTLAVFALWAQKIRASGVKTVTGDLLLDDHAFDTQWIHPEWDKEDLGQWWTAPSGALSLNDNCIDIVIQGGKKQGDPARVSIAPDTRYVTLTNKATTVKGTPKKPVTFSWENGRSLLVKGEVKINAAMTLYTTIDHPTLFFGTVLKESLEKNGITVQGTVKVTPPVDSASLKVLVRHQSDLLPTIQIANRNSQNFYAECLLKRLGYQIKHEGSSAAGVQAVQEWLKEIGLPPIEMTDGCGLARGNKASPSEVVSLLKWIIDQPFAESFVNTLAVSGGSEGTLRHRFKDAVFAGKIHAKTGYIQSVKAISGYVDTNSKDRIVFSILANGVSGNGSQKVNDLQEDILRLLIQQQ